MHIRIRAGLDIPIAGAPVPLIENGPRSTRVALLGADYPSARPRVAVAVGDRVRLGQPLFTDRRHPEICFTAPAGGVVSEIRLGPRRGLEAVVVALEEEEEEVSFTPVPAGGGSREHVRELLLQTGLWTALRTRPFSRIPEPGAIPADVFVTAMDTNPLAGDPRLCIAPRWEDFVLGLRALTQLTPGSVYLCQAPGPELVEASIERVVVATFEGPHPAGLPGTHIHFLSPADREHPVWHIGYQDVIEMGRLLASGRLDPGRVIALGGGGLARPRLLRSRRGAWLPDLLGSEDRAGSGEGPEVVIAGSILSGRRASGPDGFLGRYQVQISVLPAEEGPAWSARPVSLGPFLPLPVQERVCPLGILPAPLLRALLVGNVEAAAALGALELDAEDLALLSFVCPGKHDYGGLLRSALERLQQPR